VLVLKNDLKEFSHSLNDIWISFSFSLASDIVLIAEENLSDGFTKFKNFSEVFFGVYSFIGAINVKI
jgi:hypothetical protein